MCKRNMNACRSVGRLLSVGRKSQPYKRKNHPYNGWLCLFLCCDFCPVALAKSGIFFAEFSTLRWWRQIIALNACQKNNHLPGKRCPAGFDALPAKSGQVNIGLTFSRARGMTQKFDCGDQKPMAVSLSIFERLSSIEEWTYLSSVMVVVECPSISLSDFISNPTSTHLVANVWRSVWK